MSAWSSVGMATSLFSAHFFVSFISIFFANHVMNTLSRSILFCCSSIIFCCFSNSKCMMPSENLRCFDLVLHMPLFNHQSYISSSVDSTVRPLVASLSNVPAKLFFNVHNAFAQMIPVHFTRNGELKFLNVLVRSQRLVLNMLTRSLDLLTTFRNSGHVMCITSGSPTVRIHFLRPTTELSVDEGYRMFWTYGMEIIINMCMANIRVTLIWPVYLTPWNNSYLQYHYTA